MDAMHSRCLWGLRGKEQGRCTGPHLPCPRNDENGLDGNLAEGWKAWKVQCWKGWRAGGAVGATLPQRTFH